MNRKIKVSAVSYLNTKPLLYGIERHSIINDIDLQLEYPALIAQHLREDTVDIGLVPVAAIPSIPNARIVSDYGIAADGKVASVCIYSRVPIEEIDSIYLDYQSRTSVRLAQVLLKHYWKIAVPIIQAPENYIELIKGKTAGVIIGDRALQQNSHFEYVYDLAEYWKTFTGLPFVFAAWVANKDLPEDFISKFNEANKNGLAHIDEVVAENRIDYYDLQVYYRENIQYDLNEENRKGLELFLEYLKDPTIV
ncbi:menaquinone biosynthesis protein [Taibaiella lutea]|uniref:Chorismate dehydratase n=1 Tax=Taibaiella lutea TaxID=2608001 RepID=A0A5M6CMQ7_9BACT|nr:menaquinone biosynthesis protein [Taibaiella lutea]KAA5536488.1 menaquinone biosynthesis protein [Taibaiella lutea]